MTFDELKSQALREHDEIENIVEKYGCGYLDAKQALKLSKEKGIDIKQALDEATRAWRAGDFVPRNPIEM